MPSHRFPSHSHHTFSHSPPARSSSTSMTMETIFAILIPICFFLLFIKLVFFDDNNKNKKNNNTSGGKNRKDESSSKTIGNNYRTLTEVETALRQAGLESSDMIVAIDCTKSNTWQGKKTFGGMNLHALSHSSPSAPGEPTLMNPYQEVISTLSDVLLKKLDDDCRVPLYGFGDSITGNQSVFKMNNEQDCNSKEELMCAYADAASRVTLSGPTSFAPIIYEAIDICKSTGKYHILVIIADGVMDDVDATKNAIVAASKHPLSIVMVGVGDGQDGPNPWKLMEEFDDEIEDSDFDNFQFVSYTSLQHTFTDPQQRSLRFATESLMELPEQYKYIKSHGMLGRQPQKNVKFTYRTKGKHHFPSSFVQHASAPPAYPHIEGVMNAGR